MSSAASDFLTITERYLKENSIVNDNVDPKILRPIILSVQDLKLRPILGSDLFDDMADEIKAGNVSAKYVTLLDSYILPTMLWYCLCDGTPAMQYKYMNKGIVERSSENATPVDLDKIKFLMNTWENKAKEYAERISKFLDKNLTTYPLYCANIDCDDIKPNKTNYRTSIYLGDDRTDEEEYNIKIGNY
jgi:hypothetical protein